MVEMKAWRKEREVRDRAGLLTNGQEKAGGAVLNKRRRPGGKSASWENTNIPIDLILKSVSGLQIFA